MLLYNRFFGVIESHLVLKILFMLYFYFPYPNQAYEKRRYGYAIIGSYPIITVVCCYFTFLSVKIYIVLKICLEFFSHISSNISQILQYTLYFVLIN